jgi:hypothetical protein
VLAEVCVSFVFSPSCDEEEVSVTLASGETHGIAQPSDPSWAIASEQSNGKRRTAFGRNRVTERIPSGCTHAFMKVQCPLIAVKQTLNLSRGARLKQRQHQQDPRFLWIELVGRYEVHLVIVHFDVAPHGMITADEQS